jgi:hypothetical protein
MDGMPQATVRAMFSLAEVRSSFSGTAARRNLPNHNNLFRWFAIASMILHAEVHLTFAV